MSMSRLVSVWCILVKETNRATEVKIIFMFFPVYFTAWSNRSTVTQLCCVFCQIPITGFVPLYFKHFHLIQIRQSEVKH